MEVEVEVMGKDGVGVGMERSEVLELEWRLRCERGLRGVGVGEGGSGEDGCEGWGCGDGFEIGMGRRCWW